MFTKQTVIAAIIGAAVVAAAWVLTTFFAPGVPTVRGDLKVSYMVVTSPSTSTGDTVEGISAIEFHPGYIVTKDVKGNGRAFFPNNTQEFKWATKLVPSGGK